MTELAATQASRGVRAVVYSIGEEDGEAEYRGFRIRYLHAVNPTRIKRIILGWRCAREIIATQPEVVHLHSRAEIAWMLRRLGSSVPVVLSCDYHHEPLHGAPIVRAMTRLACARCLASVSLIAPVSQYCAGEFEHYWKIPTRNIAVIPNGVDTSRMRPDPEAGMVWRRRLGLDHCTIILYVGRLCAQKGTDLLVQAWRELRPKYPNARLVAVGPANRFGHVDSNGVMDELEREGGVHVPPVSDDELPGIYNMADIFVMPTREYEMFGMAAVEAQACGKPVVASDNGGLRETVQAGLHFSSGNAGDLASALDVLVGSPQSRRQLAMHAQAAARIYSWDVVADRCDEVYAMAAALQEDRSAHGRTE